jgi:four helix bundle protein
MGDYRQLMVWTAARRLAGSTYAAAATLPGRDQRGLGDQMRRAAVSVASNIAEGAGRGTDREFGRFLRIARGSLHELSTQAVIATDLNLGEAERFRALQATADEVGRLLSSLIRRLAPRPTTKD